MPSTLRILVLLLVATFASAQTPRKPVLAPTPPMGWNSWDAYGLTINEQQFRDNVDVLASKLLPSGYNYAVIDEGWFFPNPQDRPHPELLRYQIDANGRYTPVPDRFPAGFEALSAYVHGKGLKFGIHIVRGIPRESVARNLPIAGSHFTAQQAADQTDACPWDPTNWGVRDTPAGRAWYNSLLKQYAAWGVDYLKVDCISDHPYKSAEIRMIHDAIVASGRPMVLSLSPGPTSAGHVKELQQYAQMWRISDDIWDYWTNPRTFPRSLRDQFELAAAWVPFAGLGSWPDADMLPLGYLGPVPGDGAPRDTRLTHDEQRTMLTLWSMARSPLVVGANLTKLDAWTLALLTNPAVLELDQHGHGQMQAAREGTLVTWTSQGAGATRYIAFFNLADKPARVHQTLNFYGLDTGRYQGTEVWTDAVFAPAAAVDAMVAPHGCLLYRLTPAP